MDKKDIKIILEALLLASETPLTAKKANAIFDNKPGLKTIESCLAEIQLDWKGRGLDLKNFLGLAVPNKRGNSFIFKDYTLKDL